MNAFQRKLKVLPEIREYSSLREYLVVFPLSQSVMQKGLN